ncbi:hypothetical protein D3C81_1682370 [compost metagenome]
MAVGDHPRAHVVVNHYLNHVAGTARCTKKRFSHGPGADIVLNVYRYPGMTLQRVTQWHLFNVIVKRHAMNDAILGIDNARHGDGNGR